MAKFSLSFSCEGKWKRCRLEISVRSSKDVQVERWVLRGGTGGTKFQAHFQKFGKIACSKARFSQFRGQQRAWKASFNCRYIHPNWVDIFAELLSIVDHDFVLWTATRAGHIVSTASINIPALHHLGRDESNVEFIRITDRNEPLYAWSCPCGGQQHIRLTSRLQPLYWPRLRATGWGFRGWLWRWRRCSRMRCHRIWGKTPPYSPHNRISPRNRGATC